MKDFDDCIRGRLEIAAVCCTGELAELRRALDGLEGNGWVCMTDRVERWRGLLPDGYPLHGELALDERTSVALRHTSEGWQLHRLVEHTEGDDRAIDHIYLGSETRLARLRYRVWWRAVPQPGHDETVTVLRPLAARFAGFEEDD